MGVYTFLNGSSRKGNIIEQLHLNLAYFETASPLLDKNYTTSAPIQG